MRLNHIHVSVRDLGAALESLERVWKVKSDFRNDTLKKRLARKGRGHTGAEQPIERVG